jgi:hypothetical protein
MPDDLRLAGLKLVALYAQSMDTIGKSSETRPGGYNYNIDLFAEKNILDSLSDRGGYYCD